MKDEFKDAQEVEKIQDEDTEERESYSITSEKECTDAIERIRKFEALVDRYSNLCNEKIAEYTAKKEAYEKMLGSKIGFYKIKIEEYVRGLDPNQLRITKAGTKFLDLPDGKVSISEKVVYTVDKKDMNLINFLKSADLDYVKSEESVMWKELKETLSFEDGLVLIKNSGLVFPNELISASKQTEIKIK